MSTDTDLIAAAKSYVDALVSHDPAAVPFHPDCTRIELGVKTGRSGDHLRRSLAKGPQYRVIHTVSDFTPRVEGPVVHVTFYVHVQPKPLGLAAKVTESFEFDDDGRIVKIIAKFGIPRRRTP
ncbi:nuclear transport factor 2 family protein [Williamsia sp. 1135]|uniref:nuclear transport factor 2 family protein n=1 Tax=Williamsia sp. 1135 TaxID=1889262 RepID=UPI000A10E30D|nr:nuclear transport factor 2 family protein [Williamsia sp. 1135]ORM35122.1 hypothetical protein BFL43_09985 [Williamsia sp. 1135]